MLREKGVSPLRIQDTTRIHDEHISLVEHHIGDKIKWCYLGKYEKLPEEYKRLIHKDTQTDTQNTSKSEKPKFSFSNQTKHDSMWAGSSAWHERLTCTQEDAGSNPARSTTMHALVPRLFYLIVEY